MTTKRYVYADHASTGLLNGNVAYLLKKRVIYDNIGNPSSIHSIGVEAAEIVNKSRAIVGESIGAKSSEIVFTSSGSESNNMAIKGIASVQKRNGKTHIITSNIEHPSVLETCRYLEANGFEITYIPVDKYGFITANQVKESIRDNTALVSIMFANHEIGTIQPIKEITSICKDVNIPFHTDAVQAVGSIDINVGELGIDLMSVSGHKFGASQGIGILYKKNGIEIDSLIHGGNQEHGLRAGTENVLAIEGFGVAIRDATDKTRKIEKEALTRKRDYLINMVLDLIPECRINGSKYNKRLPGNINLSFAGVDGEALLLMLDLEGISVSTGSACLSGSNKPSYILKAIGTPEEYIYGSIRISLSDCLTIDDINYIINKLIKCVKKLRGL